MALEIFKKLPINNKEAQYLLIYCLGYDKMREVLEKVWKLLRKHGHFQDSVPSSRRMLILFL